MLINPLGSFPGQRYVKRNGPITQEEADSVTFLTAAAINEPTQRAAIDYGVRAAKAAGLWSKIVAWYPIIGGTALAHSKNLKDSALHAITWVNSPTHDASGVKSNGTTSYGHTSTLFPTALTATGGFSVIHREAPAPTSVSIGVFNGGDQIYELYANGSSQQSGNYGGTTQAAVAGLTAGEVAVYRDSATSLTLYKNAVSVGTNATVTSAGGVALPFFLLAESNVGAPGFYHPKYTTHYRFTTLLTPSEILAFYNICRQMETMLGRAV